MDFLDPQKKRAHNIRLFVGYALIAVALSIATLILVFQAYGFNIDRNTGTVIQNGLVFFDAKPEAADIYINGKLKARTDARILLPGGTYSVELQRAGYRTWKKVLNLDGGSIERLVYPVLFPTTLVSKEVAQYTAAPSLSTQSPDRRWVLIQQPAQFNVFDVYDVNNSSPTVTVRTIPKTLFTPSPTSTLSVIEWSNDNRHLLLKHVFEGGYEYVIFDREAPENSINLSKTLASNPEVISLRDKKYDQYYVLSARGADLQQVDLKNKQFVTVAERVESFKPHTGSSILYATKLGADPDKVLIKLRQNTNSTVTIRSMPVDTTYLLDLATFDGHWYVVAGSAVEQKVYIYKDILSATAEGAPKLPVPFSLFRLSTSPEFVSFSNNSRFIAIQSGSRLAVYDLETGRQFRYESNMQLAARQKIQWMDGHRLTAVSGDTVTVLEFDGTNSQKLSLSSQQSTFFDQDYTSYFTFIPSTVKSGTTALSRTDLKVAQ